MSTSDIDFICPETGSVHRIGQNAVDVGHGARPTGPQICLNCRKTLHELLAAQDRNSRIDERTQVALDNYRDQTFFEETSWQDKFNKLVENNERRLAELNHQADSEKEHHE